MALGATGGQVVAMGVRDEPNEALGTPCGTCAGLPPLPTRGNPAAGGPGVMIVDRGDLARQLRRLGQQAKLRRGNPTDRRWH